MRNDTFRGVRGIDTHDGVEIAIVFLLGPASNKDIIQAGLESRNHGHLIVDDVLECVGCRLDYRVVSVVLE